MRMAMKGLVMFAYCHGWVQPDVVTVLFRLFDLKGA